MSAFSELLGKTLSGCTVLDDNSEVHFITESGETYRLHHNQDCCESVYVEDISGDLSDLIGSPILLANEVSGGGDDANDYGDVEWTFYNLCTNKGGVTIRWNGSSNGYYSISVRFEKMDRPQ